MGAVEDALERRKQEQRAKEEAAMQKAQESAEQARRENQEAQKMAVEDSDVGKVDVLPLEERMSQALEAQREGAQSKTVTTASTESGTGAFAAAGGEPIRDLGTNAPDASLLASSTVSPDPSRQISAARVADGSEILQSNAKVSGGTVEQALTPQQLATAKKMLGIPDSPAEVKKVASRTFQHLFAGAGVIMSDGRRLVFGGRPGNIGIYVTEREDEIKYLEDLSKTPGSQVTEPGVTDATTLNDLQRASMEAQANTRRDLDPTVAAARENLNKSIAQNS